MPRKLNVNNPQDPNLEVNRDHWINELRVLQAHRDQIAEGGGAKAAEKQRAKGKMLARERVVQDLRQQLHNRVAPGRQKRGLKTGGVKWSDMTFKYVLLPLWIGTYHYQGKLYQVFVNGQTGKVSGEKPRDMLKTILLITSMILSLLVVLAFLALAAHQMGFFNAP